MPSSILFAALAAAWLVVLVPMFARRRPGVTRTTDDALAARVVRRGSESTANVPGVVSTSVVEEASPMPDVDPDGTTRYDDVEPELDDEQQDDGQWRRVHSDDVRAGRRYRPGRGGFDPEAAALAARAKYARRQRIVLFMLIAALATAVVAVVVSPLAWWAQGFVDLMLVGYLTYLRRQVRIEEDVRNRRLARLSAPRDDTAHDDRADAEPQHTPAPAADDGRHEDRPAPVVRARPVNNAVALEIDDEDPMFEELDERTWEPYRRAAGE